MATNHLKGSASFEWTPPGGTLTVHLLAVPLSPLPDFRPRTRGRIERHWSWDNKTDIALEIGVPVHDLVAAIRFENEPSDLEAMLMDGLRGVALTYIPLESGTEYPVKVVSVNGSDEEVELRPDRERGGFGEYECVVHLRRVDGGTFVGLQGL